MINFNKKDLKNGDVVLRENGDVEIILLDLGILINPDGYNRLESIKEDLTDEDSDDLFKWDIVQVRRPEKPGECQFAAIEREWGKLVYDRAIVNKSKECKFCMSHEAGDVLYERADWDDGVHFESIFDIKYCPVCGCRLKKE